VEKQVRPKTEGWTQAKDDAGKPLLQFTDKRKGKPPVHLADLNPAERKAQFESLGIPGFRASQISTHYFSHYTSCPEQMTDLPKAGREELVAQVLPNLLSEVRRLRTDDGKTIKFLWKLFDGALVGEPLANYNPVMQAIRTMLDSQPNGLGMSARNITVSTVGLVPAIQKLAEEDLPITFALSLHAPDDELRDELVPVNTRWKVDEALDAAKAYFDVTGRRVSIEYALIKDMNDHNWRAELLAKKLNARGKGWVHVNPIPLNPTPGSVWTASTKEQTASFLKILENNGIPTTLRDTRGKEIDGACGQLAASLEK